MLLKGTEEPSPDYLFQSSPDPKAGCYVAAVTFASEVLGFNPHPTRRPGATRQIGPNGHNEPVSILTRPEGRVLLLTFPSSPRALRFQSSPDPKAGCYMSCLRGMKLMNSFNPHPTRRPGATYMREPLPPVSRCFNPHPTRRPGATASLMAYANYAAAFQSSPDPKAGCYGDNVGDPCLPRSFNPHPTRRPGATHDFYRNKAYLWFQSSPDPKAGFYQGFGGGTTR